MTPSRSFTIINLTAGEDRFVYHFMMLEWLRRSMCVCSVLQSDWLQADMNDVMDMVVSLFTSTRVLVSLRIVDEIRLGRWRCSPHLRLITDPKFIYTARPKI